MGDGGTGDGEMGVWVWGDEVETPARAELLRAWRAGFGDLLPIPESYHLSQTVMGGGHKSPHCHFTSSVLASIFLWVRASRRTTGQTPRSCVKEFGLQ